MSEHSKFCTFFLEGSLFAIEVEKVQEVVRNVEMTRVPLAPPVVGGLINLRGRILTAIDLRIRLGLNPRPANQLPRNIVLEGDGGPLSLLVDEISGVLEIPRDAFVSPPASLKGQLRALLRGVHKLPDKLLMLLDAEKVGDITAEVAASSR